LGYQQELPRIYPKEHAEAKTWGRAGARPARGPVTTPAPPMPWTMASANLLRLTSVGGCPNPEPTGSKQAGKNVETVNNALNKDGPRAVGSVATEAGGALIAAAAAAPVPVT